MRNSDQAVFTDCSVFLAEAEAVDLLLEIESIKKLQQFVERNTFQRVCLC